MSPKRSQLELHLRLDPTLAGRLRRFATASERTLGGSIRLLVKDGLDRLDENPGPTRGYAQEDDRGER
jgi:hypothetical protein